MVKRWLRHATPLVAGAMALSLATAGSVAAARPTVTIERDLHFTTTQYFPASACGPGTTEIATGNSHQVVVDDGETIHVQFTETFKVHMIWDGGLFPDGYRQGTDALQFSMTRGGVVVFHEAFHDFGPAAFRNGEDARIQLFVRFTSKDGNVIVDHFFGRDLPPDGC